MYESYDIVWVTREGCEGRRQGVLIQDGSADWLTLVFESPRNTGNIMQLHVYPDGRFLSEELGKVYSIKKLEVGDA